MKNDSLILKGFLLPTEDASPIVKFIGNLGKGMIVYEPTLEKREKDEQNQHIYLCSSEEINSIDNWVLCPDGKTVTKVVAFDTDIKKYFVIITGAKCFVDGSDYKKIILTTDTKLIANGVPAIDEDTKAVMQYFNISHGGYEVNFLTEFCKRWNDKDKGVDVEKLAIVAYNEYPHNPQDRTSQEHTYGNFLIYKKGLIDGHSQALQNTGRFSLEDIHEAIKYGVISARESLSIQQRVDNFIQSLTPQPKGEMVIECGLAEYETLGNDIFNKNLIVIEGKIYKIKFNSNGQPILTFK